MHDVMKIAIKIILLVGVLAYLVFGIVNLSRDEDQRICIGTEIIIKDSTNCRFVDENFVEGLIAKTKKSIKNTPIRQIDIKYIEQFVQASPYIDSALCYYTPNENEKNNICFIDNNSHFLLYAFCSSTIR